MSYLTLQGGLAILRISGEYRVGDGILQRVAYRQAVQPGDRIRVLVDLHRMTNSDIRGADMVHMAIGQQQEADALGDERRVALYGPANSVAYGLARMYEAFCHASPALSVRVFDDPDAALDWLGTSLRFADLDGMTGWKIP